MSKKIRNKYHRENLFKELKKGYLEATKEMTVNGIIKIIKTIENLEIEIDNARKEILRLNNIDIEEDIKEVKNILGKKILVADNVELISLISKDENKYILIYKFISRNDEEKENKRDCTIKGYKDTSELFNFIEGFI